MKGEFKTHRSEKNCSKMLIKTYSSCRKQNNETKLLRFNSNPALGQDCSKTSCPIGDTSSPCQKTRSE